MKWGVGNVPALSAPTRIKIANLRVGVTHGIGGSIAN